MRHALDEGLTFLDTAAGYGDGHSEELVARAISGRRDGVVLATKFAHTDSRPDAVRQSLEASLRRLRTDYVDLFQQHWPPPDIPLAETLGALERLKEEGKIRAIGVSNWMEPEWAELADPACVDSLQPCYSLLWRPIEPHVLPLCRAHDIAVLPYSPLCQGVLAGRFTAAADIPQDMRQANHQLQPAVFPRVREVVHAVEDVGRTYGKTAGQTALLHLAGVHSDRKMALHSPSNSHQALQGPVPAMHFQAQASGAHHHNRDTVGKSFRRAYFRG